MAKKSSKTALSPHEKSIIKALLNEGGRNQDILVLINTGRAASINFGRIAGVKANKTIQPATKYQVEAFRHKKLLFDHATGLCPIDNERLVRAREAMILAVELFNTPRIAFKAGVFSMLAYVAWTYMLHEFYDSKGVQIVNNEGYSLLLSQMISRPDCPLSKGCRKNLEALKQIRDLTEHRIIGPFEAKWLPIFQATCLNFEKYLTDLFSEKLTLGRDLGFALQFAKLTTDEIAVLQGFDLPKHISALDAKLAAELDSGEDDDIEYQFKVVYTLTNATKSSSHYQFIQPDSAEGKEIHNVLLKYKPVGEVFPFKPVDVVKKINEQSPRPFNAHTHQKAWKKFNVRPNSNSIDPTATKKEYCCYHAPYNSYTYSQAWVDFLLEEISYDANWELLIRFRS